MSRRLETLVTDGPLDVLIVGGGIVGAAAARDAAMRGLRIGLIEQNDFASGTSGRSTRLLHGGLRYLAQARLLQVRQASREKRILARIAPHLSRPLPFVFPTYRGSGWPRWKLRIGVKLYEWFAGRTADGDTGGDRMTGGLSAQQVIAQLPQPRQDGLTGGVRYFDALTNDARLVIDTLRSAALAGATVCNYARFESAKRQGEHWACRIADAADGETVEAPARAVVNAAGPWADRLPHCPITLRRTKGVHLVIGHDRLPIHDAVVMTESRRVLFAIPWGRRVILGTTDTDYDGPLDAPACDERDMAYVLDVVNHHFPQAKLAPSDVRSTWAGLRALVAASVASLSRADRRGRPSDISRRHAVAMSEPGWFTVTGGKLTTCRLMAQELVDGLVKWLAVAAAPCRTAKEPLLPREATEGISGIAPPPPSQPLVEHYCRHEWARHIDDIMLRRSHWRHYEDDAQETAQRVAAWMGRALDWSDRQRDDEIRRYAAAATCHAE